MRLPTFIRRVFDPLTERVPVLIAAGPNRGRLWNLASAGGGYATGRRARAQMDVLRQLISAGDVVWDVGAHHGSVTLLASAEVGPDGWVYAFEPGRQNRRILERHIRWNRLRNASALDCALASYTGTARFGGGATSKMHSLGAGDEEVKVSTGAALVDCGAVRAPTFVKIDVEGAEGDALEGTLPILSSEAVLMIAVHSTVADARCSELLRAKGFALYPSPALAVSRRDGWHGDPDLLCVGPDHKDDGRIAALLRMWNTPAA